jgi:hypothetical protein
MSPRRPALLLALALLSCAPPSRSAAPAGGLRAGAAAAEIEADDSMVIGGGIHPGKAGGQEGKLRAVALVVEKSSVRVAIVACDVLMVARDLLDEAASRIERETGIPFANILVNCTHTHHAPSTVDVHAYSRDATFCRRLVEAVVRAAKEANGRLAEAGFSYRLGHEASVGQNSRLLLRDGSIYWIGDRSDAVRPTGPFDPELPVLAFRDPAGGLRALLFNHSTHTIGTGKPGARSPSFYGMAAQELEGELGGVVSFLEGASGSTHNLGVPFPEMVLRVKDAVKEALGKAEPRPVDRVAALKREFSFRVRRFDEAKEDEAVSAYCRKRAGAGADSIIEAFRAARRSLAPRQGEERKTWLQVVRIGDAAVAGVPAEFFTTFGLDIKRRSPFRHTVVAELANDWIGYLPDRRAFELGGYQTWTGFHSFAEIGTGERVVEEVLRMLREIAP